MAFHTMLCAAVRLTLQFLRLHVLQFVLLQGLESERIEANVTGSVVLAEKTGLTDRDLRGIHLDEIDVKKNVV